MNTQTAKIADTNIKKIHIDENFSIGDIDILPFSIPHDAANPCGYSFFNSNDKLSIATDIGHMNNYILKTFLTYFLYICRKNKIKIKNKIFKLLFFYNFKKIKFYSTTDKNIFIFN